MALSLRGPLYNWRNSNDPLAGVGYVVLDINANAAYEGDREWMIRLLKSPLFYQVPPGNIFEIFRRLRPRKLKAGEPNEIARLQSEIECELTPS